MLVLYIFVGIIVLIFYYIYFLNNIQENLTNECQNIIDSQKTMSNRAAFETKNGSYCQYDGDCVKVRSQYCGTKNLELLPAPVFKTKQECENNLEPYLHLSASECVSKFGRGWCTDSNGNGRCLVGNEQNPTHQFKNPNQMCYPSRQGCLNSWKYGFDNSIWNLS